MIVVASSRRMPIEEPKRMLKFGGGEMEFTCVGFAVRLNARFSDLGSIGSWQVIDGWGNYEGVRASGILTGTITEIGIDDRYTGVAR